MAHQGTQWKEQAEATLAMHGLLAVARGHEPDACKAIVDINLGDLPELGGAVRQHCHRAVGCCYTVR